MIVGAKEHQGDSGHTSLRPLDTDLDIFRASGPAIAEIIDAVDYDDARSVIHAGRCLGDWHDRLALSQSKESAPDRSDEIRALRRVYAVLCSHQSELVAE